MIQLPLTVNLTVNESRQVYGLTVESNSEPLNMEVTTPVVSSTVEDYAGPYTATATTDGAVVLNTEGKKCTGNITVAQLPEMEINNPGLSINNDTGVITATAVFPQGYNNTRTVTQRTHPLVAIGDRTYEPMRTDRVILSKGQFITGNIKLLGVPTYSGPTEITPTEADQIVEVKDLLPAENITVKRIPNNYGRIEWNGSYITII